MDMHCTAAEARSVSPAATAQRKRAAHELMSLMATCTAKWQHRAWQPARLGLPSLTCNIMDYFLAGDDQPQTSQPFY